jgi:hypothetical protein
MPITEDELHLAVMSGKRKKAPGYDGINFSNWHGK